MFKLISLPFKLLSGVLFFAIAMLTPIEEENDSTVRGHINRFTGFQGFKGFWE